MKSLVCRLCFMLPIAVFGVFFVWIIGGIFTNFLGAGIGFYCSVYCKVAVSLILLACAVVSYTQVRACCRESKKERPKIPA